MSQDSIFNLQPDASRNEPLNPFQQADQGEQADSPFASVSADDVAISAAQNQQSTQLPEPRQPAAPAQQEVAPFQLLNEVAPAQQNTESPFSIPDRGALADTAQAAANPFQMTGLGLNNGESSGAVNGVRESAEAAESPFAAVAESPLDPSQDFVSGNMTGMQAPVQQATPQTNQPFQSAPQQAAEAQVKPEEPAPASPAPRAEPVMSKMKQLELRAIFGVNHELNENEIIQRARSLPGVRNVTTFDDAGVTALDNLKNSLRHFGLNNLDGMEFSAQSGVIDFVTDEGGGMLAVLHEGQYAPGVRETLIIASREIHKLK